MAGREEIQIIFTQVSGKPPPLPLAWLLRIGERRSIVNRAFSSKVTLALRGEVRSFDETGDLDARQGVPEMG
jgi:hypothetical protein